MAFSRIQNGEKLNVLFIQKFANVKENFERVKIRLYLVKNWFLAWDGLRQSAENTKD
jgi:hypothetical protein